MNKLSRLLVAAGTCTAALTAMAQVSDAVPSGKPRREPLYAVEYVPPPDTYRTIDLQAVNNAGESVGIVTRHYQASIREYWLVVRHADGTLAYLAHPPGCKKTDAFVVRGYNDAGQILLDTRACVHYGAVAAFRDPLAGWTKVEVAGGGIVSANAMNNRGDVVGNAYHGANGSVGFVWNADGRSRFVELQDATALYAINDHGQMAGDVTHYANPGIPGDRTDQSAARISPGGDTVYTGDLVIDSLAGYRDPQNAKHAVLSHAAAINADGDLGLVTRRPLSQHNAGCVWRSKQGITCSPRPVRDVVVVGIGRADELVVLGDGNPKGYAYFPERGGVTWALGDLAKPYDSLEKYWVHGTSESGYMVGSFAGHGARGSFVLTPLGRPGGR